MSISGSKKASAASTRVLGAIKRHVGIGEKLLRRVAIVGIECNADTCSDVREAAVDIKRSLEGIHKPSRQRRRGRGLVALATRPRIHLLPRVRESRRASAFVTYSRRICASITRPMPVDVVHFLKVVEVDAKHGEGISVSLRLSHDVVEPASDSRAVGEPGQGVVLGELPNDLFGLTALP